MRREKSPTDVQLVVTCGDIGAEPDYLVRPEVLPPSRAFGFNQNMVVQDRPDSNSPHMILHYQRIQSQAMKSLKQKRKSLMRDLRNLRATVYQAYNDSLLSQPGYTYRKRYYAVRVVPRYKYTSVKKYFKSVAHRWVRRGRLRVMQTIPVLRYRWVRIKTYCGTRTIRRLTRLVLVVRRGKLHSHAGALANIDPRVIELQSQIDQIGDAIDRIYSEIQYPDKWLNKVVAHGNSYPYASITDPLVATRDCRIFTMTVPPGHPLITPQPYRTSFAFESDGPADWPDSAPVRGNGIFPIAPSNLGNYSEWHPQKDAIADEYESRKIAAVNGIVSGEFSLPNEIFNPIRSLIELRDLPKTWDTVRNFLKYLRHGHLTVSHSLKEAASAFLGYQFGVKPVADDVRYLVSQTVSYVWQAKRSLYKLCEAARRDANKYSLTKLRVQKRVRSAPVTMSISPGSPPAWDGRSFGTERVYHTLQLSSYWDTEPFYWAYSDDGMWLNIQSTSSLPPHGYGLTPLRRKTDDPTARATEYYIQAAREIGVAYIHRFMADYEDLLWGFVPLERALRILSDVSFSDVVKPIKTGWELLPLSFVYDWFTTTLEVATALDQLARMTDSEYLVSDLWNSEVMRVFSYIFAPELIHSVSVMPATEPYSVADRKIYTATGEYAGYTAGEADPRWRHTFADSIRIRDYYVATGRWSSLTYNCTLYRRYQVPATMQVPVLRIRNASHIRGKLATIAALVASFIE